MIESPSWGVLVKAPADRIATTVRALRRFDFERFAFRTNGDWTAVFYMEPTPTNETDAAEGLRAAGIDAIHLDFDRDRYRVHRWAGDTWAWTGEDPVALCGEVGIQVPGHAMPTFPVKPFRPERTRAVSLVENMSAEEVQALLCESDLPDTVDDGPRGALVTKHVMWADGPTYGDLSERVPNHVYHLEYDPEDGRFVCLSLRDGEVQAIFEVGNTWVPKNAPLVDNVEGETTVRGIIEKLGIPESFLSSRVDRDRTSES